MGNRRGMIIVIGTVIFLVVVIVGVWSAFGFVADQSGKGKSYSYTSISMAEAKEIFAQPGDYIILDVRREDEFKEGHIPGAIQIANEEIGTTAPPELPNKDQTIYVYCRSGRRSKEAADKLAQMGYSGIIECGGILNWTGEIVTVPKDPAENPNDNTSDEQTPALDDDDLHAEDYNEWGHLRDEWDDDDWDEE